MCTAVLSETRHKLLRAIAVDDMDVQQWRGAQREHYERKDQHRPGMAGAEQTVPVVQQTESVFDARDDARPP